MRSILFVCTANLCRSPMAEGVFRRLLSKCGAEAEFEIDSAGTHDYQPGQPPHPLAVETARRRGYDIVHQAARRIGGHDFDHFDMILVMDGSNLATLKRIAPTRCKQKIERLLDYGDRYHGKDIPDPIGKQGKDFELALDMIEDGCKALAELLIRTQPVRVNDAP